MSFARTAGHKPACTIAGAISFLAEPALFRWPRRLAAAIGEWQLPARGNMRVPAVTYGDAEKKVLEQLATKLVELAEKLERDARD